MEKKEKKKKKKEKEKRESKQIWDGKRSLEGSRSRAAAVRPRHRRTVYYLEYTEVDYFESFLL